jgi:hypothetical protein
MSIDEQPEPDGFIVIEFNNNEDPLLQILFEDPNFKHHRSESYGFVVCYATHRVTYPWHTIRSIEIHYNSVVARLLKNVDPDIDGGGS